MDRLRSLTVKSFCRGSAWRATLPSGRWARWRGEAIPRGESVLAPSDRSMITLTSPFVLHGAPVATSVNPPNRPEQPTPHGQPGEIRSAANPGLVPNPAQVALDGLERDEQSLADLPIPLALGHQLENLALSTREGPLVLRTGPVVLQEVGGKSRRDKDLPSRDGLESLCEFGWLCVLRDIPACSCRKHLDEVVFRFACGQDEDVGSRPSLQKRTNCRLLHQPPLLEGKVEQHEIRFVGHGQGPFNGVRLAHDCRAGETQ